MIQLYESTIFEPVTDEEFQNGRPDQIKENGGSTLSKTRSPRSPRTEVK